MSCQHVSGFAGAWSRRWHCFRQRRRNRLRRNLRRHARPRNDGPRPFFEHVFDKKRAAQLLDAGHVRRHTRRRRRGHLGRTRRGRTNRRERPRRGSRGRWPTGARGPRNDTPGQSGPWRPVVRRGSYLASRPRGWPCSTGVGWIVLVLVFGFQEGAPIERIPPVCTKMSLAPKMKRLETYLCPYTGPVR